MRFYQRFRDLKERKNLDIFLRLYNEYRYEKHRKLMRKRKNALCMVPAHPVTTTVHWMRVETKTRIIDELAKMKNMKLIDYLDCDHFKVKCGYCGNVIITNSVQHAKECMC